MSSSIMLMSPWACESKGKGGEKGEKWRGGDLVEVFNSHLKYHIERISMYRMYLESLISRSVGDFLQYAWVKQTYEDESRLTHKHTYTYTHSDMLTNATGKARVSGVSQGRLRLKALIDCSYGVYVPWLHLSVCQRVLPGW